MDIEMDIEKADESVERRTFYGQFDPPVDQFLFDRYFRDRTEPGVLIECGAFDGVFESSCKFFEESLGWQAINIEASPRIYAKLIGNRPLSINLNCALSNRPGHIDFVDVDYPGYELCTNGSVSHLQSHRELLDSANCTYSNCRVRSQTFRNIVENLSLKQLDLMVLDVEGHELQALEGFQGAVVLPKILCVEHGHLGVAAIREVVEPLGYAFDTTSHVNSFFVLN